MYNVQAATPAAAPGTTRLSAQHKAKLKAVLTQNSNPSKPERETLANELGLQLSQVSASHWYSTMM